MPRGPSPLKTKLKETQFYCVSCRKRVNGDNIKLKMLRSPKRKNGRAPALRAKCMACDTNLTKFVAERKVPALKAKY